MIPDLLEGSQLAVHFDETEAGDKLLNFSCNADAPAYMGFEHVAYQCTENIATKKCDCIVNPRYVPLLADAAFKYTILATQKCVDTLGPYYCQLSGTTDCVCFRRLRATDLHNTGYCLQYNLG